jgi:hypothetical protein
VLLFEFLVGFDGIGADAEDDDPGLLVTAIVVAEPASLDNSAGGVVFGVEEERHGLAAEFLEAAEGIGFVGDGE